MSDQVSGDAGQTLPAAPCSAEMLELPNDTKIRFSNAWNAMARHYTVCKQCQIYLIEGDGDLCAFGKTLIAKELCFSDTSIVFPPNTHYPTVANSELDNNTNNPIQ